MVVPLGVLGGSSPHSQAEPTLKAYLPQELQDSELRASSTSFSASIDVPPGSNDATVVQMLLLGVSASKSVRIHCTHPAMRSTRGDRARSRGAVHGEGQEPLGGSNRTEERSRPLRCLLARDPTSWQPSELIGVSELSVVICCPPVC